MAWSEALREQLLVRAVNTNLAGLMAGFSYKAASYVHICSSFINSVSIDCSSATVELDTQKGQGQ